jgi:hypothetical protein
MKMNVIRVMRVIATLVPGDSFQTHEGGFSLNVYPEANRVWGIIMDHEVEPSRIEPFEFDYHDGWENLLARFLYNFTED